MNRKAGRRGGRGASKFSPCTSLLGESEALHHALKMFAELLHEPLFTEDASARELQAPRNHRLLNVVDGHSDEQNVRPSSLSFRRSEEATLDWTFISDLLDSHLARWRVIQGPRPWRDVVRQLRLTEASVEDLSLRNQEPA